MQSSTPHIAACRYPLEWSAARSLLSDYIDWLNEHITCPVSESEWRRLYAELDDLEGAYAAPNRMVVAWVGRVPVAILGVQVHGDTATLGRCFTRPIARGTGIAGELLTRVLADLTATGIAEVILDAIPEQMPAAFRLYQRAGFEPAGPNRRYPEFVRMTRSLVPATTGGDRAT